MRIPIAIEADTDLLEQLGLYWESHSDSRIEIDCALDIIAPIRKPYRLAEEFPLEWDSAM